MVVVIYCSPQGKVGARYFSSIPGEKERAQFWKNVYNSNPQIPETDPNVLFALSRLGGQQDDITSLWSIEGEVPSNPLELLAAVARGEAIRMDSDDIRYYSLDWWAKGQPEE